MKTESLLLLLVTTAACWAGDGKPAYKTDPRYAVDGEYRGRFTPAAEYVLSGQFREDLGPLPEVPYRYVTDEEGYASEALSPVPPVGVHPRVLMGPADIERLRAEVGKGDGAHPWFRIVWNDICRAKPTDRVHGLTSAALVALVTEDDRLGRELVGILVAEARFREPMIDILNSDPAMAGTRDNWYYYARTSILRVGGVLYADAVNEGGAARVAELAGRGVEYGTGSGASGDLFNTVLRDYDYLYPFMTDEERALVRRVIAKATSGRYTTGMELPGNWFINNHMSMGEDLLITHLAIEGEEGYDPRILREYSPAVRNKLTYDISVAGNLHEKCKGFLPERATIAISRRAGHPETGALPLLRHDHLRAMVWAKVMDSINIPFGTADIGARNELERRWWMGYGSGPWMDQFFNWAFVLKHVYPEDPVVDYFYKERLIQAGFGPPRPEGDARLPTPRIRYTWRDLMLLTVTPGLRQPDGRVIDYDQDGLPTPVLARKAAYVDMPRGVAVSRSSWDPDATIVHYECRSDNYMTGHETPEAGDFNLSSHSVVWSMRRDWYMDCYFRNMVLIDGKAGVYPPACGKLVDVLDTAESTTFVSDATNQYNWWQGGKNFYEWHGAFTDSAYHMAPWHAGDTLTRASEIAFLPHMRQYNEGFAGLDWGAWHGESRGPAIYHRWNDVDHVFRTLHMTKGEHPYILIFDDVRKDDGVHQYDWCLHLERDIALYQADSTVRNRFLPNLNQKRDGIERTDLILCLKDVPETRFDRYGVKSHRQPKEGDPMLLVRVLWRNTDYPFPQPVFEEGKGGSSLASRIRIPALAVDPEYRVLLFPHRFGDKLPVTAWNADRTQLTVRVDDQVDTYNLSRTDRDRTVLTMRRGGETVVRSGAGPAVPRLQTPHGWTIDQNAPDAPRTLTLTATDPVAFKPPPPGQVIRYTVDGSEPGAQSELYRGPIEFAAACTLKARTFARYWPYGDDPGSGTAEFTVRPVTPASPMVAAKSLIPGLVCQVYEKHHTIFDEKTGIFTGRKNMLPVLTAPVLTCRLSGFAVPDLSPSLPAREMSKAYYRYAGFLRVSDTGVHGFAVNSCGPVVLRIAGQPVIDITGPYGLSQKTRYGQATLMAGLHAFELIVCDPMFWKDGRDGPYAITVDHLPPGGDGYAPIATAALATDRADITPLAPMTFPTGQAVIPGDTVPGLVMNCYDRMGLTDKIPGDGLPPAHLTVAVDEQPYLSRPVLALQGSDTPGRLVVFEGYLIADTQGTYHIELDPNGANQMWIDGQLVAQNRVDRPAAPGAIVLAAGYHHCRLLLAGSSPTFLVRPPGMAEAVSPDIGIFARPAAAEVAGDDRLLVHLDGETLEGGLTVNLASGATATLRKGELTDGRGGRVFAIKGEDSRLEITGLKTPEDALSICFWMRIDARVDRGLVDNTSSSHPGARLRGYALWAEYYRGGPVAVFDLSRVGADKGGKWSHIALVYGPTVTIYVDGIQRDWQTKEVVERHAHVSALTLFRDLQVSVDDLRVYNRVLLPGEIAELAR